MIKRRFDFSSFWSVWLEVIDFTEHGGVVIVEGKNDRVLLSRLALRGNVVESQSIPNGFLESNFEPGTEFLILTDFDNEGENLASILEIKLVSLGFKVNKGLRMKLKNVFGHFKEIESLSSILEEIWENAPFDLYLKRSIISPI